MSITISKADLFSSKAELENKIKEYEAANSTKLWKRSSKTLTCKQKNWPTRVFNQDLHYYEITFCCINGGGKCRSRSDGQRPNQKTFRQACPFQLRFRATKDGTQLECVDKIGEHNHTVSQAAYEHLPSQRRLDQTDHDHVAEMLRVGANRKLVRQQLSEKTGKRVIMQDIHNIGAIMKNQLTPSASETPAATQSEAAQLAEHLKNYPGLTTHMIIDQDTNRLQGIYIQDEDMINTFDKYPELLIADTTHKVNEIRMPLMLLGVVDGNGATEIVAAFILESEGKPLLTKMISMFKEKNAKWSDIKVILTDKDMAERQVFSDQIPQANLQLCLFHTIRAFKRQITTEKMGISAHERTTVLEILQEMAYCRSEEAYQQKYEDLLETGIDSVTEYFTTNWHSIRSEWVKGLKHKEFSLNEGTTNRVESTFQKVKSVVKCHMTIFEFCRTFLGLLATLTNERDHRAINIYQKTSVRTNLSEDGQLFAQHVTPYALDIINKQLELMSKIEIVTADGLYTAISVEGTLQVTAESCTCLTYMSQRMPCRHIFKVRQIAELPLFDENLMDPRWTKERYAECHRVFMPRNNSALSSVSVVSSPRPKSRVLSHSEKFKKVMNAFNDIASLMAEEGMSQFNLKYEQLCNLKKLWQEGKEVFLGEVVQSIPVEVQPFPESPPPAALSPIPSSTSPSLSVLSPIPESPTVLAPVFSPVPETPAPPVLSSTNSSSPVPTTSTASSDIPFEDVLLPEKIRKRGRPKGSTQTVIGLPSKRRKTSKPIPFVKKQPNDRDKQVLMWFVTPEVATRAMSYQGQSISENEIEVDMAKIPSGCLDENFSIRKIRRYFDADGYISLKHVVEEKEKNKSYECGTCEEETEKTPALICDGCLVWYHLPCIGKKHAPKTKYWFCSSCTI